MGTTGGYSEHHVADGDVGPRQQIVTFGGADGETCQIVVSIGIHAGHFGRLAADQGAARSPAPLGDPRHQPAADLHVQATTGIIVQKEQGLGALDHDVVDAHRHQIDPDGVGDPGLDRHLQFRADPVGARNQDGVAEPGGLEIEKSPESAESAHDSGTVGGPGQRLDMLDQGVAGIDVDTSILVGQGGPVVAGVVGLQAMLIRARQGAC